MIACRLGLHRWTPWGRYRGIRLVNLGTGEVITPTQERRCTRVDCNRKQER